MIREQLGGASPAEHPLTSSLWVVDRYEFEWPFEIGKRSSRYLDTRHVRARGRRITFHRCSQDNDCACRRDAWTIPQCLLPGSFLPFKETAAPLQLVLWTGISALRSILSWVVRGKGEGRRDSSGPIEESDRFFKFQCISGFGVCHVCGAHIFT